MFRAISDDHKPNIVKKEGVMAKKILAVLFVFFMSMGMSSAAEVGGSTVPDTITCGTDTLVLNGAGIRKKFGFKVYVGALYLKEKSTDAKKIIDADEPMAITMIWKRSVKIKKINSAYKDGFEYTRYDSKQQDVEDFLSTTVKSGKGDVWQYTYMPGKGVDITFNNKTVKTIPGLNFKKALFAIWLHDGKDFEGDTGLRKGMLGGK